MPHKSRTIFLVNDNVRAVLATYEVDRLDAPGSAPRTMFKTFDKTLKVGDYVLVPTETRHNMTVVKIAAVDVDPEIDSELAVEWVIGIIDRAAYENTLSQEGEMLNVIKSAEKAKRRAELAAAVLADSGDKVKTLTIASRNDGPAKIGSAK